MPAGRLAVFPLASAWPWPLTPGHRDRSRSAGCQRGVRGRHAARRVSVGTAEPRGSRYAELSLAMLREAVAVRLIASSPSCTWAEQPAGSAAEASLANGARLVRHRHVGRRPSPHASYSCRGGRRPAATLWKSRTSSARRGGAHAGMAHADAGPERRGRGGVLGGVAARAAPSSVSVSLLEQLALFSFRATLAGRHGCPPFSPLSCSIESYVTNRPSHALEPMNWGRFWSIPRANHYSPPSHTISGPRQTKNANLRLW